MRSVSALLFAAFIAVAIGIDPRRDSESDKLNSVETNPSVRLDPYIRKALLRALTELEETSNVTVDETTDNVFTDSTETLTTLPGFSRTQNPNENIQIHSFVVNGQAAFDNKTETSPTIIDNISILSTTAGNVENHVTATLPTKAPFDEIFQTKASGVNIQQVRSIQSGSKTVNDNIINNNKLTSVKTSTTTSTTKTPTTTTPKPTHNADGENIETVDQRDVQVFQAPLVAAFTVHQDAAGIPKKVVPIYQQTIQQNFGKSPSSSAVSSNLPLATGETQKSIQQDFITQQLLLQKQLEEKQRVLEEQLQQLQNQQRQQEELLKKQQFLLLQKDSQIQSQQLHQQQEQFKRQQLLAQQQRIQANNNINNFQLQQLHTNQQLPVAPQAQLPFNSHPSSTQSSVSILPSIPLDQSSVLAVNQQQLPNREAVDFLLHLRNQQKEQFPLQENHLPQGISNFLQPQGNFHQGPNLNQVRPIDASFRQKQANRVFRHESGVGNLGLNNLNNFNNLNNNFNRFNGQTNFGQPNRFFSSQLNPDAELQQLLVQTGLDGRNPEDLNIVSKVLSLNHGVPLNNLSNRLPFDTSKPNRQNFIFNRGVPFGRK